MPYLKFSRDRRGYESTYLLHASRRQGGERPRLLYWFRTPPHVKVGRAAFDEDAIRALEENHPDLTFDWKHILQARPPAAPEAREREGRAPRKPERGRKDRAGRAAAEQPSPPAERAATDEVPSVEAAVPPEPRQTTLPEVSQGIAPSTAEPAEAAAGIAPEAPAFDYRDDEPPAPRRRLVRVFDVDPPPPPPVEHHATDPPIVNQVLGDEAAELLRARYAELLARIASRITDPQRAGALREQAERLNPDTWVTEEEVRTGAAQADQLYEDLRRLIGGRRRRRRRRSRGARPDQPAAQAGQPGDAGESGEPGEDDGAGKPDGG